MRIKDIIGTVMTGMVLLTTPLLSSCGSEDPDSPAKTEPGKEVGPPEGKQVFIPADLRKLNLKDKNSNYYWGRTKSTEDVILFWAKGFGDDLSKAPSLQGQNMTVDAGNLLRKVQEFYDYYYDVLKFVTPGKTKADKYRMMVMLDYSLEGTAYGGTYDDCIGALWVAPNRVQDKNMNAVAHELGHSFQLQILADKEGEAWGGCGFYEMTSQWMLWQVNPDWIDDEYYHLEEFYKNTHKCFLHIDNIYHSPFVIEAWGEKRGVELIANLFRKGKVGEDPVITYKKLAGLSQEAFNDEMWENYSRLVNFDFKRVRDVTRKYTDGWQTKLLAKDAEGWQRVAKESCPENYGFNAISVGVPEAGKSVTVDFRGEATQAGYKVFNSFNAGWRYGFVGIDSEGKEHYGDMHKDAEGTVSFSAPEGKTLRKLWFVVMGAPQSHSRHDERTPNDPQYPYSIRINQP